MIHQPYSKNSEAAEPAKAVRYLNTNKHIVAIGSGALDPKSACEYLFIGSKTNLLVYGKCRAS